jgi:hypothetical protein
VILRKKRLQALLEQARREGARVQREANIIRADLIPVGMSLSWDGKFTGTPQEPGTYHVTVQTRDMIPSDPDSCHLIHQPWLVGGAGGS